MPALRSDGAVYEVRRARVADSSLTEKHRPGGAFLLHNLNRAVIVAVIAVRMVQVSVYQIVDVVAVRYRLVPAAGAVTVARLVAAAGVIRRAAIGIFAAHFQHVLVNVVAVRMMEVTIVEIINVVAVANRGVPTVFTVRVIVIFVVLQVTAGHRFTLVLWLKAIYL